MNLLFNIEYKTVFGEDLILNVVNEGQPADGLYTPYRMYTTDGLHWKCDLKLSATEAQNSLCYYYSVECDGKITRKEWTTLTHRLDLTAAKAKQYHVYDHWMQIPEDSYLYSSAFTDCLHRSTLQALQPTAYDKTVRIIVRSPQLKPDQHLVLSGDTEALGEWNISKALPMTQHQHNEWVVDVDAETLSEQHIELKFAALSYSLPTNDPMWEPCFNRTIDVPKLNRGNIVVYHLDQAFMPMPNTKVAGTLVPVFSLRSKGSFGVGDFGDLKAMIDFVEATGQHVLQLLPINDTTATYTYTDSYPYSCISVFALHPLYCDLRQLPKLNDKAQQAKFDALQEELNCLPQIDYVRVMKSKMDFLQLLFKQEGKRTMGTKAYKAFFEKSARWLVPYAQFCYLRDQYGTADATQWCDHHTWNEADRKALSTPSNKAYQQVAFYYFVQFVLYTQMKEAHAYAQSKRIVLKGDVPIGVSRHGCDVWVEPKYFNMDGQAGAPPDDFSVNGQNWGFPTYNWDEMLKDGCAWWERRFKNMAEFFDAYRIDHVLGFFRIWEIPISCVNGLCGQFSPSLALSREEIASYGLNFQEDLFTKPYVRNWIIDRVFGEHQEEVIAKYLNHIHDDVFELNEHFNTERKIEAAFEEQEMDEKNTWIRDGLYALANDVLFVRDKKNPHLFHPRITAQFNFIYESLWDVDKQAFNRLYNEYYYRRNNQFWYHEAMKKLPKLVQATRMLVCAEDLGMVPDCVAWVMNELRILSLEVQSMPKDPKVTFGYLPGNPYRSVATISSHDMPTLRQWWDEDYPRTQHYYNTMLGKEGPAPHPLPGWLARDIIWQHLASPSMLCILSIQDWLSMDERLRLDDANAERINIPANPKHYWRYRMHLNIEDMLTDNSLVSNLCELNSQSGRG